MSSPSTSRELEIWVSHLEELRQRREQLLSAEARGEMAKDLLIDEETLIAAQRKARNLYDHAGELAGQRRFAEALANAVRARELAPHESATWLLEAQILLDMARAQRSIEQAEGAALQAERAVLLDPGSRNALRVRTDATALVTSLQSHRRKRIFRLILVVLGAITFGLLVMTGSSDSSEQAVAVAPVPPAPVEPVPEPEPHVVLSAFPIDSTPPPSTLLDNAIERPWRVEHQDDLRVQLTFTPPRALTEVEVRSSDDRNYARPRRVDVRQDDNGAFRVELPRDRDATASISLDGSPVSTLELRFVDVWPGRSRDTRTTLSIEQLLLHPAATP